MDSLIITIILSNSSPLHAHAIPKTQIINTLRLSSQCINPPVAAAAASRHRQHPPAATRSIRKRKSSGKWVSEIREPRTPNRIWLGSFPTPEMAAAAYDAAAFALKGREAQLNFPDSAASLPVPASTSPRDIQAAAGAAGDAVGRRNEAAAAVQHQFPAGNDDDEFVDEDLIFDMPNVLMNMAQGMMISPPRLGLAAADEDEDLDGEDLWSYR